MKLKAILICVFAFCIAIAGCSSADVMDDIANNIQNTYSNPYGDTGITGGVDDTLDLILNTYVSGLNVPSKDRIQNTTLDQDAQDNRFENVTDDCDTVDEMRQCILQALANTEPSVTFKVKKSIFSTDVLYDTIYGDIHNNYMIEAMGLTCYSATYLPVGFDKYSICVEFEYFEDKYSVADVKQMKYDCLEKAKEIVRDLNLANKTEYERVYEINKYLCDNCVYPDAEPYSCENHSIYGLLFEKTAVCEGYARTAQLLFSLSDLESYYVVGPTQAGYHAWNIVKVDDAFYQIDVTWNDSEYGPNRYFLVTDEYMSQSRSWDTSAFPATATTPY